jgi:putative ATP-binding cassette transporter
VGLPNLADNLNKDEHWGIQLSPGEQQRTALARSLVQNPEWLFLDEATSSVDEPTEARLYRLPRERLLRTTLFSIGHRPTLRRFHPDRYRCRSSGTGPPP